MANKVIVIGGGPVGLFTALSLESNGYEVMLFEKRNWPIDKVCGQGLMPLGKNLLEKYIPNFVATASPIKGIEYINAGKRIYGELPSFGIGARRLDLSMALFNAAKDKAKIKLFPNHSFIDLDSNKVIFRNPKNEILKLSYDYLIACDGLHSQVRNKLDLTAFRVGRERLGARVHFKGRHNLNHVKVFWKNGIEAYITPSGEDLIEVAFLWFKGTIDNGSMLKNRLFEIFPEIHNGKNGPLKDLEEVGDFGVYGPFLKHSRKIKKNKVFLVGDAYNFIDGITGEGLTLGFYSSDLISKNLDKFNIKESWKIHFAYKKYAILVRLAQVNSLFPGFRKIFFALLKSHRLIFNKLLRINDYYV